MQHDALNVMDILPVGAKLVGAEFKTIGRSVVLLLVDARETCDPVKARPGEARPLASLAVHHESAKRPLPTLDLGQLRVPDAAFSLSPMADLRPAADDRRFPRISGIDNRRVLGAGIVRAETQWLLEFVAAAAD